jgi:hypothetical protein
MKYFSWIKLLTLTTSLATAQDRIAHVFVALCDNQNQGIQPVPAKIGNGQDPVNNLYWGNSEGLAGWFGARKSWQRLHIVAKPEESVLERRVYRHVSLKCLLVADAYDGACMNQCLSAFFGALAGKLAVRVPSETGEIDAGGAAHFVAFLGHNGLMERGVTPPELKPGTLGKASVVLGCQSAAYFLPLLKPLEARPLLLTKQNMYPGAFLLEAALSGWLAGKEPSSIRVSVAAAYAQNQKISQKSALGVFWDPAHP